MDQNIFQLIELVAVVTSAIYGILQARASRMDALGVFTLAFVVAFGGGTLRDLFLDRHPLFWIANAHYPMIVFPKLHLGSWLCEN
ncbi:MAG: TRIC cation channel family protein [Planctomycetota bacterium]